MGRSMTGLALAAAALLGCSLAPALAFAATARARFGLTLVIAPPCGAGDPASNGSTQADGIAGTPAQARDLASAELGVPGSKLLIAHDQLDTGWWIVSLAGRGGPEAVLRVEKCTGTIERI